jgi:vitamin B12 transporter
VTGRTEVDRDDVLAPVIVITRELDRSLAPDVASLLQFHAGIDVARNGGPGQTTTVFIRGAESNHTTVLVDGVRINPGTIGGAQLQHITPSAIEFWYGRSDRLHDRILYVRQGTGWTIHRLYP